MEKQNLYVLTLLLTLMPWMHILAQSNRVSFEVHAPSIVETGKPFQVVFQINRKGDQFNGPDFKGFTVLSGPGYAMSSRAAFINGRNVEEVTSSYTYALMAHKPGTYQIDEARMRIGTSTYASRPVTIRVTGQPTNPNQTTRQNTQTGQQRPVETPTQQHAVDGEGDLFIHNIISNRTPYKGEVIVLTQKLYTRLAIHNINRLRLPSFSGFWTENIDIDKYEVIQEYHQGKLYNTMVISQTLLIPQRTGNLVIEPSSINIQRFTEKTVNRNIFGNIVQQMVRELTDHDIKSSRLTIKVKDVPEMEQPISFRNAIGQFSFNAELSGLSTTVGVPVNLTITIEGNGNLKLLDKPEIQVPDAIDLFDPEVTGQIQVSNNGMSGTRIYQYLIIPRDTGTFTIPELQFTYFDPSTTRYHTLVQGPFEIQASPNTGQSLRTANVGRQGVEYFGQDIRHIRLQYKLPLLAWLYPGSITHLFSILIPLLVLLLWMYVYRKRVRMYADKEKMRAGNAAGIAQEKLRKAKDLFKKGSTSDGYEILLSALWGLPADKLNLKLSDLTRQRIKDEFLHREVPPASIGKYIDAIETCEFCRYAPSTDPLMADTHLHKTEQSVNEVIAFFKKYHQQPSSKRFLQQNTSQK
jgi:hypothetical protein